MACNMRTDLLISQICPTSGHVSVKRRIGNASVVRAVVDHNTLVKDIIGSTGSLIMRRPPSPKPQLVEVTDHERKGCKGKFGRFGGKFVPETLISCLSNLEAEFNLVLHDAQFQVDLATALRDYVGRETPLYFAERLTNHYKKNNNGEGPEIYLKREDLNHGGAHKINNAIAQAMIAKRLGRKSVVAATGAGQHGVATAAACAKLSLQCTIFMGTKDMEKQSSNLVLMKLLGAEENPTTQPLNDCYMVLVGMILNEKRTADQANIPFMSTHFWHVKSVDGNFKEATSEAFREWVGNLESSYYLTGTVVGPHPCPSMVREFQSVIGKETRRQAMEKWGGKPDVLVACVGSGSNALGLFHEFIKEKDVRLIGVEAGGFGLESDKHSATLAKGDVGVYHGTMSYLLQDEEGQIIRPHSVGVGLEYPAVGPELSFLKDTGRAEYYSVTDKEALDACQLLCRLEGIIPSLEASHALAFLNKLCPTLPTGTKVVVNCSGRGDKDAEMILNHKYYPMEKQFPASQNL